MAFPEGGHGELRLTLVYILRETLPDVIHTKMWGAKKVLEEI